MRRLLPLITLMILIAGTTHGQVRFDGFETLEKHDGREEPVGWSLGTGSKVVNESHTGNNALSVWTWYCSSRGWAVLGDIGERRAYLCDDYSVDCYGNYGTPIDFKPTSLTGYYRYVPGGAMSDAPDSAMVLVLLKKYNANRGTYDTIGTASHRLVPADAYTPFTAVIEDRAPGVMPDSVAIVVFSAGICDCAVSGDCYFLSVDDLAFTATSGISYPVGGKAQGTIKVYPNPNRGTMLLRWGENAAQRRQLRVYSITGALVRTINGVAGNGIALDSKDFSPGEYLVDLTDTHGAVAARGRFVVQ